MILADFQLDRQTDRRMDRRTLTRNAQTETHGQKDKMAGRMVGWTNIQINEQTD